MGSLNGGNEYTHQWVEAIAGAVDQPPPPTVHIEPPPPSDAAPAPLGTAPAPLGAIPAPLGAATEAPAPATAPEVQMPGVNAGDPEKEALRQQLEALQAATKKYVDDAVAENTRQVEKAARAYYDQEMSKLQSQIANANYMKDQAENNARIAAKGIVDRERAEHQQRELQLQQQVSDANARLQQAQATNQQRLEEERRNLDRQQQAAAAQQIEGHVTKPKKRSPPKKSLI